MSPVVSLFAAAALVASVLASPVEQPLARASFVKTVNRANLKGLVARDQARAQALVQAASGALGRRQSVPVTNTAVSYLASVGVGSPATSYNLIVDTGSSNTWVGASTSYQPTDTSSDTGATVSVSYGSGSFSGEEFTDLVTLSDGLSISGQSIGVASTSTGFDGVDGILGIGPAALTQGTLSTGDEIPTVTDNLASQGAISANLVAISFEPPTSDSDTNGELTFGATDSSKFTGKITFTPITSTSPASQYWGIDQDITYAGTTLLSSSGIVDTGTTLLLIATDAFNAYVKKTGATMDRSTGLLKLTAKKAAALSPLNFIIGGTTFSLSADAQQFPQALNADLGGDSSSIYLVVADLGSNSGSGLDFINGQSFLERFYSVFDTDNQRVGIAKTPFTTSVNN